MHREDGLGRSIAQEVANIRADIEACIETTLGPDLIGLYLYGSYVTGGFDVRRSDLDYLAVLRRDPVGDDLPPLIAMHDAIVVRHPEWVDRVEVAYLSCRALQTFRETPHPIAVISPGEPLNIKEAGADWLLNWYIVRVVGITIVGPPAKELMPLIARDEFIAAACQQARAWKVRVTSTTGSPGLSYAVLSSCRSLHTCVTGEQASKYGAADWAAPRFPHRVDLIERAKGWPGPASTRQSPQPISGEEASRFIVEINALLDAMQQS